MRSTSMGVAVARIAGGDVEDRYAVRVRPSDLVLAHLANRDVEAESGPWLRAEELAAAEAEIVRSRPRGGRPNVAAPAPSRLWRGGGRGEAEGGA